MRFIDWFSGIGGFRLGLERAGHTCVGACEIDEYPRRVYLKHWPETEWFPEDITKIGVEFNDVPPSECFVGGFPCQDISYAGKGAGITGSRSGLFATFARAFRVVRPRNIILENVPALLGRGMGKVCGALASCGYDSEWDCLPASAFGAPHRRDRVWIVAQPASLQRAGKPGEVLAGGQRGPGPCNGSQDVADAEGIQTRGLSERERKEIARSGVGGENVSHPNGPREQQPEGSQQEQRGRVGDCHRRGTKSDVGGASNGLSAGLDLNAWRPGWEDGVPRVASNIPNRPQRLRGLGNAVVPQIVEWIGRGLR